LPQATHINIWDTVAYLLSVLMKTPELYPSNTYFKRGKNILEMMVKSDMSCEDLV